MEDVTPQILVPEAMDRPKDTHAPKPDVSMGRRRAIGDLMAEVVEVGGFSVRQP